MVNLAAARARLIVALDVPSAADAIALADNIGDAAEFYKIGLELFAAGDGRQLVAEFKERGLRVFADLKLFDVPATVARAAKQIAGSGADFLTVHGNDAIMQAAAEAKGETLKILAVTALTSLDEGDLRDLGFACDASALVLSRARRALQCGCDGVVSSGLEVEELRRDAGEKLIIVSPGVRPVANRPADDQKRTASAAQIIRAGADYLVVGRAVRDAPDPRAAAQNIVGEIAAAMQDSPA
ncbi:MAG: orotidine-5'-phosphate decarboxylase [Gammaproteobacteria bacterium]